MAEIKKYGHKGRRPRLQSLVEGGAPLWRHIARDKIWGYMVAGCPYTRAGKKPPFFITARSYGKNSEGITVHALPIFASVDPHYYAVIPKDGRADSERWRVRLAPDRWRTIYTIRQTMPILGERAAFILTERPHKNLSFPQAFSVAGGADPGWGKVSPLYSDRNAATWAAEHEADFDRIAAESFEEAMEGKQ